MLKSVALCCAKLYIAQQFRGTQTYFRNDLRNFRSYRTPPNLSSLSSVLSTIIVPIPCFTKCSSLFAPDSSS